MSMVPPQAPPGYPQPQAPAPVAPAPGYPPQAPAPAAPAPMPPQGYPAPPMPTAPVAGGPFPGAPAPMPGGDTVNWADLMQEAANAPGFQALPIGAYNMIVDDCEAVTASSGKLMYKTKFKVMDGQLAGRTFTNHFVVSPENPNALKFFFRHMACFGLDGAYFAQQPHPTAVAAALIGRSAMITLKHRQYNGEMQNEVDKIEPIGGAAAMAPQPMAVQPQMPMAPPPAGPPAGPGYPTPPQAPPAAPQPAQYPPQAPPMAPPAAAPGYPPQAPAYPPQGPPQAPAPQPGQAPW